jgi:hypothetical protein
MQAENLSMQEEKLNMQAEKQSAPDASPGKKPALLPLLCAEPGVVEIFKPRV